MLKGIELQFYGGFCTFSEIFLFPGAEWFAGNNVTVKNNKKSQVKLAVKVSVFVYIDFNFKSVHPKHVDPYSWGSVNVSSADVSPVKRTLGMVI